MGYADSVVTETSPNWDLEVKVAIIYHAQALVTKDFLFI